LMQADHISDGKVFKDVSFQLRRGEILGIAGVEGCGKNEVIRTIFGERPLASGTIKVNGKNYYNNISKAIGAGIAFLPAERKTDGLFLKQDLAWNTSIAALDKISRYRTLKKSTENKITDQYIKQLRIKCSGSSQKISSLSGGNQQKVMLSRWLMTEADILLLEEPTRGIDVKAKTEVYEIVGQCVRNEKAVIVVSSEEEEVLGICDQILVMKNGSVKAVLDAKNTTTEEIKHYSV